MSSTDPLATVVSIPWMVVDRRRPLSMRNRTYLTETTHGGVLNALDNLRHWITHSPLALASFGRLILADNTGDSTLDNRLQAGREFAKILLVHPPPIIFAPTPPDASAETVRVDEPNKPWFSRSLPDRIQNTSIRITQKLLNLYEEFEQEYRQPMTGPTLSLDARYNILLFHLSRTVLHELGHVATSLFRQNSTPTRLYKSTTIKSPDATGVVVPRGEAGWESEMRVGGECAIFYTTELRAANITGCRLEVDAGVFRFIGLGCSTLLQSLARVEWSNIRAALLVLPHDPDTVPFSTDSMFRSSTSKDVAGVDTTSEHETPRPVRSDSAVSPSLSTGTTSVTELELLPLDWGSLGSAVVPTSAGTPWALRCATGRPTGC